MAIGAPPTYPLEPYVHAIVDETRSSTQRSWGGAATTHQGKRMHGRMFVVQAAERRLERRVPLVATEAKAAAVAQLMGIIQQHHHPLQCRSYMVPCFVTSSTTGAVRPLHTALR